MANLESSIDGKDVGDVALYFGVDKQRVRDAIAAGARTYQHVYDFIQDEKILIKKIEEFRSTGLKLANKFNSQLNKKSKKKNKFQWGNNLLTKRKKK